MGVMLLGLVVFLGVHSLRIVAEGWRLRTRARVGEKAYMGIYSLVSALGLVLMVWGFSLARQQPQVLWATPVWARHVAALLMLLSFVLLTAAYVPGNSIKARLHHPMMLSVKVWAVAHLLANNTLAELVFFGSFLLWAALSFRAARARDHVAGTVYAPGAATPTFVTVGIAVLAWVGFAFWAHRWVIGVSPF